MLLTESYAMRVRVRIIKQYVEYVSYALRGHGMGFCSGNEIVTVGGHT